MTGTQTRPLATVTVAKLGPSSPAAAESAAVTTENGRFGAATPGVAQT